MNKLTMLGILATLLTQDATIRIPITFQGNITAAQFVATTPMEPPLIVASSAQVANLNASLLGGQPASAFGDITAVTAGSGLTGGSVAGDANVALAQAFRIRGITYIAGCDVCAPLTINDSQPDIYLNLIGPMVIRQVRCLTEGPNVTVELTITGQANSSYNCPTDMPGLSIPMALNDKMGFVVVAGGSAHRVTFAIGAEVM